MQVTLEVLLFLGTSLQMLISVINYFIKSCNNLKQLFATVLRFELSFGNFITALIIELQFLEKSPFLFLKGPKKRRAKITFFLDRESFFFCVFLAAWWAIRVLIEPCKNGNGTTYAKIIPHSSFEGEVCSRENVLKEINFLVQQRLAFDFEFRRKPQNNKQQKCNKTLRKI